MTKSPKSNEIASTMSIEPAQQALGINIAIVNGLSFAPKACSSLSCERGAADILV
jgi:hypothetical protein